ncbi:MAG: GGDEF domain-containing protein [Lachnospiraceae bacterium]|nr:GGDEF domain-containing protein [Lachnospiraceae bacterium]
MGDKVLQRLGWILSKEESANVTAYRYGGEEFVLILEKEILGSALGVAQRIRTSMEHESWDFDRDKVITLSLGIADGSGDEDVVSKADENLYISKKSGKNRVTGEIKYKPHKAKQGI